MFSIEMCRAARRTKAPLARADAFVGSLLFDYDDVGGSYRALRQRPAAGFCVRDRAHGI